MSRILTALAGVLVLLSAGLIYRGEREADVDRQRLAALEAERARQAEAVKALRAELAYLENPERLTALARSYLGMTPVEPLQVVAWEQAPRVFAQLRGAAGQASQTLAAAAKADGTGAGDREPRARPPEP